MKILSPSSALLTNSEVYTHILSRRQAAMYPPEPRRDAEFKRPARPQKWKLKAPNYEVVTREVLQYLSPEVVEAGGTGSGTAGMTNGVAGGGEEANGTSGKKGNDRAAPGHPLPNYKAGFSDGNVDGLVRELVERGLMQAEVFMIVNLRPGDLPSLDAVVEELDERYNDAEQQEILDAIKKWIG